MSIRKTGKRQPYIPLYTGDWLKDTRSLTLAAKGVWIDLIVYLWNSPTRGSLSGSSEDFARMVGAAPPDFARLLLELCSKGILEKTDEAPGSIRLLSRRMLREAAISAERAETGSKGGSKSQANRRANIEQNRDIDNDNEHEIVIQSIGVPGEFSVTVAPKYVGDSPRRVYDLELYFITTGQSAQLLAAGMTDFAGFLRANPAAHFNDGGHLYNAFKKYSTNGNAKTNFRDRAEWARNEADAIRAHTSNP